MDSGVSRNDRNLFYLMKTYIGYKRPLPRTINGKSVNYFDAGRDFLSQVFLAAGDYANLADEEVVFTVPVEAFEHYSNWLDEVATASGVAWPRYIDEPSAAALGYCARVRPNEAFLVFDFGGGTVDAAIVRVEDSDHACGRRCRQLGKAGAQVGGSSIDQWIVHDILEQEKRTPGSIRSFHGLLIQEAERMKKALSSSDRETFTVMDPESGAVISREYSRSHLEDVLEKNSLFEKLGAVLSLAEGQAIERGYAPDLIASCLAIGGSSLIPSVRRLLRMRYGECLRFDRPFDAVAAGAAAFAAGVGFDDRIRHEYALRPYDSSKKDYIYATIVPAGTPYPCEVAQPGDPQKPLRLPIKASHEEQTRLGLQVYEVSRRESLTCGGGGLDIVFGANGDAHYIPREESDDATHRPIGSKTFIIADPPAKKGDPRFIASFRIDDKKRLCVSVWDNLLGKNIMRDKPMVKLT
jgi:molecular chaperone DnaK (HSP70)